MLKNKKLNKRGISPVIATIIIVAVAIAIAIAVAFWVVGIAGLFTRYEKLEISYIYAQKSGTQWTINLMVKNTGSATATIDEVFLNGLPHDDAGATLGDDLANLPVSMNPGDTKTGTITISSSGTPSYNSGMTIEVKLHTAAGQEYYKAVVLP
jgi:flagellin-like protein